MKIINYPANSGDAFIISFDNVNIVVDMGFKETYKNCFIKKFNEISKLGQAIDLLIVTHIDNDHINGVISFIKENNNLIKIKEIWHNSFLHGEINYTCIDNTEYENQILDSIISKQNEHVEKENCYHNENIELSHLLINNYNDVWNISSHNNGLISEGLVHVCDNYKINVLSPTKDKFEKLQLDFINYLFSKKVKFNINKNSKLSDAFESFFMSLNNNNLIKQNVGNSKINFEKLIIQDEFVNNNDDSVTNNSSIAFVLEYRSKRILFLGDLGNDEIYNILIKYKKQNNILDFDIVKLSHHGSIKNNNTWLNLIKCSKFIFSTNGKYGHPSLETIILIIKRKGYKELYFNYNLDILDNLKIYEEKYNFKIFIGKEIIL